MKTLGLLFLIVLSVYCDRLLGVVEYFRHGARGPQQQSKLNPHQWLQNQLGELTPSGARMHYLLGHEMRKRYVQTDQWDTNPNHILPTNYNHQYIEIRTDNFARCIQSATAQLLGLYPTGFGPKLANVYQHLAAPPFNVADKRQVQEELKSRALPLQMDPIPVHIYENDSYVFNTVAVCKKAIDLQNAFFKSQEFYSWYQKYYVETGFQEQLSRIFMTSGLLDFSEAADVYDWSVANRVEGYELPKGFDDSIIQKLYDFATYAFFTALIPNDESARLQSSGFLYDTIIFFENILNGTTDLKMKLWSGHDTGITPIVKALKLEPYSLTYVAPVYATNIFFELYENDQKQHYVLIKYQDVERKSSLCGGQTCTFQQFRDEVYKFISRDLINECAYKDQSGYTLSNAQTTFIGSFGILSVLLVIFYLKKKE